MFFTVVKEIDNPAALFFAFIFKYSLDDNITNEEELNNLNTEFMEEFFLDKDKTYDLIKYYKIVDFLINSVEYVPNDLITENDYNWYNDFTLYHKPVLLAPNIMAVSISDLELKMIYPSSMDPAKIDTMVLPALDDMWLRSKEMVSKELRLAYVDKIHNLLDQYNKSKKKIK